MPDPSLCECPVPVETVDATDVTLVEQWAESARRAILAMAAELESLNDELQRVDVSPEAAVPEPVARAIDEMLAAEMARLDAEITAARSEAASAIAAAIGAAVGDLSGIGIERATALDRLAPVLRHHLPLRRPRSAIELIGDLKSDATPLGPDVADEPSAQVFEMFWRDAPGNRSLRNRLRPLAGDVAGG